MPAVCGILSAVFSVKGGDIYVTEVDVIFGIKDAIYGSRLYIVFDDVIPISSNSLVNGAKRKHILQYASFQIPHRAIIHIVFDIIIVFIG